MIENTLTFTVDTPGERLDKVIVAQVGDDLTRTQIQTLIRDGHITVNGAPVKAGVRLKGGETIHIVLPEAVASPAVQPEPIALNVVYEDDDLAVIDKPAGLVVHPGAGNESGTLVNAILARWPEIGEMTYEPKRRGIVHRLDKDTSGLILVAKNARALNRLMRQFRERSVEKTYLALLERAPRTPTGRIDVPIMRDPNDRTRMAARRGGRPAISEFHIIERFQAAEPVLVEVRLLTGRTHQIRVHMAFIEAPIVGDTTYGHRRQKLGLRRQFLHAARLCFDQPTTGERLCFESALPPELEAALAKLREK
jgi:23S rRNA pseudouridine1911/1915/1917 synthase